MQLRSIAGFATAFCVLAVLATAPPAEAQRARGDYRPDNWEELDVVRVEPRSDAVTFKVGRREGVHTAIRVRVLDESLFVRRLLVTYGNGTQTEIPYRRVLAPGETSEPIELEGDQRYIREVALYIRAEPGSRGGRVQLLGDIPEARRDAPPPSPLARDIPPGWVSFGAQQADFDADRDVIRVGREKGRFDKIAIRVSQNDVYLRDIRVLYDNREIQMFPINRVLQASQRTNELLLDRPNYIQEIALTYSSRPQSGQRAVVEVFGEVTRGYGGHEGDVVRENAGWAILGARTVSMLKSDNDDFRVGEAFGRVNAIRLNVRKNEVEIRNVTLYYLNGESETLPVNRKMGEGEASPVLELRGGGGSSRRIDRISVNAKSKMSLKGEGVVEVWARH